MAWKIASYTDAEKRVVLEAAIRQCRGEKRVSLQDLLKLVRGLKADVMRRFVKNLDAAALDELGISLEQKGPRGPVTVIFVESKRHLAAGQVSAAA